MFVFRSSDHIRGLWPVGLLAVFVVAACHDQVARAEDEIERLPGVNIRQLTDEGGRVAWYKGEGHDLIAYDAIVSRAPYRIETFVVEPDGSNKRCVTCDIGLPGAVKGQPDWHPDGKHLIVQVLNDRAKVNQFTHIAWGFDNDLWIISLDGKRKERVWASPENDAALHPHFNDSGDRLIFAERQTTGRSRWLLRKRTPAGEIPWENWRIHVADVDMSESGENILGNHREVKPKGEGFYETHGFTPDGLITFSYTEGRGYVDDTYESTLEGERVRNLTNSRDSWDEHGKYSPSGGDFAFMSSRVDKSLKFPRARPGQLVTELYLRRKDGKLLQLTNMNQRRGKQSVVSDFAWDRTGKRIAFQVAPWEEQGLSPQVWILAIP